jgi:hypothetical protein
VNTLLAIEIDNEVVDVAFVPGALIAEDALAVALAAALFAVAASAAAEAESAATSAAVSLTQVPNEFTAVVHALSAAT